MTLYFLIGLFYSLILSLINKYMVKEEQQESNKFNIIEIFIVVCSWPVFVILFFVHLFKCDEGQIK